MKELARGCRPRSRTLSSESASQMRQRDLSVTHVPVVRDLRTERIEARVVRAEHVHDLPALVRNLPERDNTDAFDHGVPPRYERYHSIVDRRPSSSNTRAFHPRTRFALSVERRCSLISFFAMFSTRGSGSSPPMSFAMALTISRTLTWAPYAKLKASPATSGRSKASATARYASTTSEM